MNVKLYTLPTRKLTRKTCTSYGFLFIQTYFFPSLKPRTKMGFVKICIKYIIITTNRRENNREEEKKSEGKKMYDCKNNNEYI